MIHSISDLQEQLGNYLFLEGEIILIEPEYYKQARSIVKQVNQEQKWQTYLNTLALLGFESWLIERALKPRVNIHQSSVFNPQLTKEVAAVSNLLVGDFKLCLIVAENLIDPMVKIPEHEADFYVVIEIWEEEEKASIRGFLNNRQFKAIQNSSQLAYSPEEKIYSIPLDRFDLNLNHLLYSLRLEQPTIPTAQETPMLIPQLANKTLREDLALLKEKAINTRLWLQGQLDDLAQSLSWTMLPAFVPAGQYLLDGETFKGESPAEEFRSIISQLERKEKVIISLPARAAYQEIRLAGISCRLYAFVWACYPNIPKALVSVGDSSEEQLQQFQEWTLLLILKAAPDSRFPNGITLQISDQNGIVLEEKLEEPTAGAYLYGAVAGSLEERFHAQILLEEGAMLNLESFAFLGK